MRHQKQKNHFVRNSKNRSRRRQRWLASWFGLAMASDCIVYVSTAGLSIRYWCLRSSCNKITRGSSYLICIIDLCICLQLPLAFLSRQSWWYHDIRVFGDWSSRLSFDQLHRGLTVPLWWSMRLVPYIWLCSSFLWSLQLGWLLCFTTVTYCYWYSILNIFVYFSDLFLNERVKRRTTISLHTQP